MKDDCHECCTGEAPEKQPDVPIEEIEEDMRRMRSPKGMDEFTKWFNERPPSVQQSIRDFPPWQLYIVKDGAPYKYTCGGSIVSSLKWTENEKTGRVVPWFRVLRSPIGYAGVVAEIDPQYLKPITLDDVKETALAQETRKAALKFISSIPQEKCPGCGRPLDPGCACINCESGGEVSIYGAPFPRVPADTPIVTGVGMGVANLEGLGKLELYDVDPGVYFNMDAPDCPKCGGPTKLVAADTFLCTNCDPNQLLTAHPVDFIKLRMTEDEIVRCGHDHDPGDKVCSECGCQLWSKEDYDE